MIEKRSAREWPFTARPRMAITVRRPISTRLRTRDHHALLDAAESWRLLRIPQYADGIEYDLIEIAMMAT
jgi:hypothetical protein